MVLTVFPSPPGKKRHSTLIDASQIGSGSLCLRRTTLRRSGPTPRGTLTYRVRVMLVTPASPEVRGRGLDLPDMPVDHRRSDRAMLIWSDHRRETASP